MGADVDKVTIIKARYRIPVPGKDPIVSPVTLQELAYWRAMFDLLPDAIHLIVEPLPSYLGRGATT